MFLKIQVTVDHNALAVGASDDGFAETNVFDNGKEIRSANFSGDHGCCSSLRPQGELRTAEPSFGSRSAMVFDAPETGKSIPAFRKVKCWRRR